MPRFHHWVHLNEKGKKLYGEVFPDGIVPVKVMFPQGATLGGKNKVQKVYKLDWSQLSDSQKDSLLELLSEKFGAPKKVIRAQFDKDGFIPLRDIYVSGAGTDQMGLFI